MPSIWHILILLLVVVLIFGTGKLRNLGSDLGGAIKSFRKGMQEEGGVSSQQDEQQLKADPPPVAAEQPQREPHETK